MRALLAAACCMALVACAAGSKSAKTSAPAAASEAGGAPMAAAPHAEIEKLDAEITAKRTELRLAEPSESDLQGISAQPMGALPSTQDPKCRPAQNETCKTSCTLSDSICSNANKICELASSLAGDGWAQNKCAKANKTCESSHAKCCGCQ